MWLRRLSMFLAVLGPGLITANVDNDANGIATYSVAGARYGYSLLWLLVLVTFCQALVQEMSARMGCVTGKGLSDLIRENFGVRPTVGIMGVLLLANLANTAGNFAGLAAAGELFGLSRYFSVPLGGVLLWLLVLKGSYQRVERVFLAGCLIYFSYVLSGFLARPPWGEVVRATFTPTLEMTPGYLFLAVALIGSTIAPWMQFYQQSAVRDKGLGVEHLACSRLDTWLGTAMMGVVAGFIIICCASQLHAHGIEVETAQEAALALAPLAGPYAAHLFALGLLNAALLSLPIIPLSTAYAVCEAFGWESGVGRSFRRAPVFFLLFTAMMALGAGLVLLPGAPLLSLMVASQVLNGMLLPVILTTMLVLVNRRRLMGSYRNSRLLNALSWATLAIVGSAAALLAVSPLAFPGAAP